MNRLDWQSLGLLIAAAQASPANSEIFLKELLTEGRNTGHSDEVVYSSLCELEEGGAIYRSVVGPDDEEDKPEEVFGITPRGIALVIANMEEVVSSFHGITWDFPEVVEDAYLSLFELVEPVEEFVPASDRTVALNHNGADYKGAVAALGRVIDEFRSDHRLENELGHEKWALLKGLEGGRQLLNDTVISVRVGTALLLEPLHRLVQKYEKELVGALASKAIEWIAKLLGSGN